MDIIDESKKIKDMIQCGDIYRITNTTSDRKRFVGKLCLVNNLIDKETKGCFKRDYCDKANRKYCVDFIDIETRNNIWSCFCTAELVERK